MRKSFLIASLVAALVTGCGNGSEDESGQRMPPAADGAAELAGYSPGVQAYYGGVHGQADHDHADVEVEYHQPPKPAVAGLKDTITLTGSNIGVRLRITPRKLTAANGNIVLELRLENTGITVYEAPFRQATLSYSDGSEASIVEGRQRGCRRNLGGDLLRLEVGRSRTGCLVFPAQGDEQPTRLQLALELVPIDAGGIWELSN